ncbi:MAG: hypothetical protein ACTTIZ_01835 [Treponema sp.]
MNKKRNKEEKEKHLALIARMELKRPLLAANTTSFISHISKILKISASQAKKDIEEVRRRKKILALLDLKTEIAKKKEEYAFIKEIAIKSNNINAYLGAVNKEADMLKLEKYSIFIEEEVEEEDKSELEEKKEILFKKLFPINEDEKTD